MIKIELDSYKEVSTFLREEKLYMHTLIVNSVKEGWKNKLDMVPVLEFHVKENVVKIDIIRDDFKNSLYHALEYYEVNEYYEKCMEVSVLIKDMYAD